MSITRVGTQTASATSLTVPAHLPGDLILIWAMRGASTTSPTVPAGYLPILSKSEATAVTLVAIAGYRIANATNDASGTWTNASELICAVYRPSAGNTIRIGQGAASSSTTNTINYPALTMADSTSGNSWVLGLAAASNLTQTLTTAFAGMTSVTSVAGASYQAALADTNAGVSSWSSTNQTVTGTAGKSVSATLEIVLAPGPNAAISNIYHHIGGGGLATAQSQTGNAFKCPLLNPSGSGNTVLFGFTVTGGATVSSVNGSVNGAYTQIKTALGGAGNLDSYVYMIQNCALGTEVITVTFSASVASFQYEITEIYGVVTSGGANGTAANPYSLSTNTGVFTPGNNNANGGNFIWVYSCKAEQNPAAWTSGLFAGPNFTLLNADNAWSGNNPLNTNNPATSLPKICQGYIQATSGAITPSFTSVIESGDHWNSIAVAIAISNGAGVAPSSGIFIHGIQHFTTSYFPATGTWGLQCSCQGNLRIVSCDDPNLNALTITDSEGNTYTADGAGVGLWYCANVPANPNLSIYITGGGADPSLSWRFIDISGASPSPFVGALSNGQIVNGLSTFTASPSPSPVNQNGVMIAAVGLGQGPGLAVTSPATAVWDFCTYTGELDTDTIENADILAHYYYGASGPQTWTFTITNQATNSTSGGFVWFQAGSGFQASADVALTHRSIAAGMRKGTPFSRLHAMLGYTTAVNVPESVVGQSITSSLGAIAPAVSYALTGQSITSTEGTVTYGASYSLTGQAITSTEGTVVPTLSYAVSGQSIASTEGAVSYSVSYGLTGEVLASTEGTISASTGGNVTLSLAGQVITSTEGTITAALSTALSGLALTSTEGTTSYTVSYSPAGQALVSTEGTVTDGVAYGVTGESATFTEGTISASTGGNVTLTLSGLAAVFSEGTIAVALSSSVAGQSVASSEGLVPRGVAPTIAGQSITSTEGVIAPSWSTSAVLAGQGISISLGTITPQVQYSLPGTGTNQFVSATVKGSFESATIAGSFRAGNN